MKITRLQANDMLMALGRILQREKGDPAIDMVASTLWTLSLNVRSLRTVARETNQLREDLIFAHSGGTGKVEHLGNQFQNWKKADRLLNSETVEVKLGSVTKQNLNVVENGISPMDLAALAPIISDFDK